MKQKKLRPYNLDIIFTDKCNLRCKYCYTDKTPRTMSLEIYKQTLKHVERTLGEHEFVMVNLFGGEPLMAKEMVHSFIDDMGKLRERTRKSNFVITIYTNSILVDDGLLNQVKKCNYVKFNFSLDGNRDAHNTTRVFANGEGSFDMVYSKLKHIADYLGKTVDRLGFKMVVSPDNYKYLTESAEFFLEEGIKHLSHSFPREDIWSDEDLTAYERELMKLGNFYVEHIDEGLNYNIFTYPIIDYGYKSFSYCYVGKTAEAVTPSGDIYPCPRLYSSKSPFKLGDVYEGLDRNNPYVNFFKNYTIENHFEKCGTCDTFKNYNCMGQCMGAMWECGSLTRPIDCVCKLLKINYKVSRYVYDKIKDNENYKRTFERE